MRNQVPVESLDDLIDGVTPEERIATIQREIEAKYAKMESAPSIPQVPLIPEVVMNEEEKETVIAFKGKSNG